MPRPAEAANESPTPPEKQTGEIVIEHVFEETVAEGEDRLTRDWLTLLSTGAVGGVDVSIGVLGFLLVEQITHNAAAAALAFGIGFIALALARSELFTEDFLVPIVAIVAQRQGIRALLRLWGGTLIMNLLAGWVMMAIIVLGLPNLHPWARVTGEFFFREGIGPASLASAVLGGAIITLMTWMERSTSSGAGKIVSAVAAGFLLAAGHLNHVIVASLEMFAALQAGAHFTYLDWLPRAAWFALGNLIGGLGLITLLRLGQIGVGSIREEQKRARSRPSV